MKKDNLTFLEDIEKTAILTTLEKHGGNRTLTAKFLGISLRGLQLKLNKYIELGFSVTPIPAPFSVWR